MSNEWYTPAKYIEAARSVMGSIDLDPASCELANQTVRATRYYTQEDNGLSKEWYGNVWLNPPFAKSNHLPNERKSNVARWLSKLLEDYQSGDIEQAIFLCMSNVGATWFHELWQFPICFPDHHVRFFLPDKCPRASRPGRNTDGHMWGTIFVYLGANEQRFIDVFSKFGRIAKAIDTPVARPRQLELVS